MILYAPALTGPRKAIDMDAIQGMILKPNQIGTLTEAIETVRFMKQHDLLVVASGRAGGVIDDPNAELAIALGLPIMKTGGAKKRGTHYIHQYRTQGRGTVEAGKDNGGCT